MNVRGSAKLTALTAVLLLTVVLGNLKIAAANVPNVLQIEDISEGSTGKIKLQIKHLNPGAGHYIDIVEVDVNGQVKKFDLQPQSADPFTVELNLGQIEGRPNIKARAHCSVHGWSDWFGPVQIPEFAEVGMTVFLALAASFLLIRAKRN